MLLRTSKLVRPRTSLVCAVAAVAGFLVVRFSSSLILSLFRPFCPSFITAEQMAERAKFIVMKVCALCCLLSLIAFASSVVHPSILATLAHSLFFSVLMHVLPG